MSSEVVPALRDLLETERVLALSVLLDGAPYGALLPYVLAPDRRSLLVHVSRLARHSRGLGPDAPFAVVIHRADRPDSDPLQLPRLGLQGRAEHLAKRTAAYDEARQAYLRRFPTSAPTFSLADFDLFALRFEKGRWIGGFARAVSLGPRTFDELAKP